MDFEKQLKIIPSMLLATYCEQIQQGLALQFDALKDADISTDTFSFYTSVSVISSSKIEGEPMEVDSYIKYKMLNINYLPNLVEKPNDLYEAYLFAQANKLTKTNFLQSHKLIAKHLLPSFAQGVYRKNNMLVMEHKTFRIQFEAAPPTQLKSLCGMLWKDIEYLIKVELTTPQIFYFASMIHIVFVNIHPFEDGNGRAGRLLEKWFIAEKLGKKAWFIQSEFNYYKNINNYYKNLNRLGIFYEELDYTKALPFLLMLPQSLITEVNN